MSIQPCLQLAEPFRREVGVALDIKMLLRLPLPGDAGGRRHAEGGLGSGRRGREEPSAGEKGKEKQTMHGGYQ